jgi:hypothetical protein
MLRPLRELRCDPAIRSGLRACFRLHVQERRRWLPTWDFGHCRKPHGD